MKNNKLYNLILSTFLIIFIGINISSCKKIEETFDYRNKYIGNYKFTVWHKSFIGGFGYDTTYNFQGKIMYGRSDSTIIINYSKKESRNITLKCADSTIVGTYSEEGSLERVIRKDGSIVISQECDNYLTGKLYSDMRLIFYSQYGGLGGGIRLYVIGEKN